jgi:hypothetical protein
MLKGQAGEKDEHKDDLPSHSSFTKFLCIHFQRFNIRDINICPAILQCPKTVQSKLFHHSKYTAYSEMWEYKLSSYRR